ncbi:MAG: hypothetical protein HYU51_04155 [Candidatus Rokubacteria bacterium]|nr:hypothetical protein [Candidatus Rokubacteria bacterium]
MTGKAIIAAMLLAFVSVGTAHATPITHLVTFDTVTETFLGVFAVDDAILALAGTNLPGAVSAFRVEMRESVWDLDLASPASDFSGFRGPIPGEPCTACLFAPSPGFDVLDGAIVGLRGGVFGPSDFPFVDFLVDGFSALPRPGSELIGGTMSIFRVASPPAGVLLLAGVLVLVARGRRVRIRATIARPGGRLLREMSPAKRVS